MERESMLDLARRYEYVSYRLEREAHHQQMEGRTKPLRRFIPCAKALVFTAAMYTDKVSISVINDATITPCLCHRGLSESDLWGLFEEATKVYPNKEGNYAAP